MGRATRWLRGLLGGKKQAKGAAGQKPSNSAAVWEEQPQPQPQPQGKGKKRWTLTKTDDGEAVRPECSRWASTKDGDKERDVAGKRDVTVAADAAAVAVEVVRLTSCEGAGRERGLLALRFGKHGDWWAAVCIQTAFRGFLARKALRALKALVKLQALVRGYLVRKQAAATLHSMEALIRAQVTVRMHKFGVLPKSSSYGADVHQKDIRHYPLEVRPRRSLERLDDSRSENATASFHSRRMSANLDHASSGFDDSPKIVEVDPGRNNRRTSDCVNPPPTPSEEYSTTDDTPQSRSSPLTINTPPSRIVTPSAAPDWELDQQCHRRSLPATAHSTPRLPRTSPAKSACGWSEVVRPPRWEHGHQLNQQHQLGHYSHPRFMAGTQSSKAKARSQSAPKQRPDPRRRLTLNEMVEARASLSGVRMQRSCSRAHQDSTGGFKGSGGPTATPVPRSCELGKGVYERDAEFLDHDIHHHLGLQKRW